MADEIATTERLAEVEDLLIRWLDEQLEDNPVVIAVEREPGERRWFVRLQGEEKGVFSLWLTIGQRTLSFETYVLPAPEENAAEVYAQLLRRNRSLYGLAFAIGDEEAVFLQAEVPLAEVTEDRLDEILGSIYETVERAFLPALRLAFASRF